MVIKGKVIARQANVDEGSGMYGPFKNFHINVQLEDTTQSTMFCKLQWDDADWGFKNLQIGMHVEADVTFTASYQKSKDGTMEFFRNNAAAVNSMQVIQPTNVIVQQ